MSERARASAVPEEKAHLRLYNLGVMHESTFHERTRSVNFDSEILKNSVANVYSKKIK